MLFAHVGRHAVAASAYAVVLVVRIVGGWSLFGGRWFPILLFTLGVLTHVVLAFSDHIARTLTRWPGSTPCWQLPVVNVGIVAMLIGIPTDTTWAIAVGATVLSV